jgi:hypothetical protein
MRMLCEGSHMGWFEVAANMQEFALYGQCLNLRGTRIYCHAMCDFPAHLGATGVSIMENNRIVCQVRFERPFSIWFVRTGDLRPGQLPAGLGCLTWSPHSTPVLYADQAITWCTIDGTHAKGKGESPGRIHRGA